MYVSGDLRERSLPPVRYPSERVPRYKDQIPDMMKVLLAKHDFLCVVEKVIFLAAMSKLSSEPMIVR